MLRTSIEFGLKFIQNIQIVFAIIFFCTAIAENHDWKKEVHIYKVLGSDISCIFFIPSALTFTHLLAIPYIQPKRKIKMRSAAYFFVIAISVIAALVYGQGLLMPLIMGMLVWFIMRALKASLNKVPFIRNHFPSWLKSLLSSAIILSLLVSLINILSQNIASLSQSYELYQPNVDWVIASINDRFNLNIVEVLQKQMGDFDFGNLLSSVLSSLSEMVGNTFMIAIYALFIVLEESNFIPKLRKLFANQSTYEETMSILGKIDASVSNYLKLKTFVSLITGLVSYAVLRIMGVDSPEFWAFLIFLLNFIPTIGSLMALYFQPYLHFCSLASWHLLFMYFSLSVRCNWSLVI